MPSMTVKVRSKELMFLVILVYIDNNGVLTALLFLSVIQSGIEIKRFKLIKKGVNYIYILRSYSFVSLINLNSCL
jgi:hypothetical protein